MKIFIELVESKRGYKAIQSGSVAEVLKSGFDASYHSRAYRSIIEHGTTEFFSCSGGTPDLQV